VTGLYDTTQVALERALAGASLRQQALANNVANINTAGFKRSDVDFHSAIASAMGAGTERLESLAFTPAVDGATSMRADGNNVDADQEMAALAENGIEYQALVAVAKARMQMLEIVMSRA
jgi:flagellar basal-body rod protein FlgB